MRRRAKKSLAFYRQFMDGEHSDVGQAVPAAHSEERGAVLTVAALGDGQSTGLRERVRVQARHGERERERVRARHGEGPAASGGSPRRVGGVGGVGGVADVWGDEGDGGVTWARMHRREHDGGVVQGWGALSMTRWREMAGPAALAVGPGRYFPPSHCLACRTLVCCAECHPVTWRAASTGTSA